jgi:hypothetical protein
MNKHQKQVVADFTNALNELDAVMESVTDDQLDWSEKEGEWSIRQVIHHLTDDGNVFTFIIERALVTPGGKVVFGEFPGNEVWAEQLGFDHRPITQAWELIHAQRRYLAELVSHFPDRWDNQVNYYNIGGEKLSEQSVENIIVMLTEHLREHVAMIGNILAAH